MSRLRILLLASYCHPEKVSMPYVTYCHAAALAQLHDVSLVVESPSEAPVRRAKAPFRTIEVVRMPLLERIYAWSLRRIFKSNFDTQVLTAFYYPFALAFEWCAWRQLRHRIFAGEFDVVLRILPMTPVLPSPFAFFLRKGPIPFVIGPLNGGLPWPPGFSQLENQKEWISNLRNLYRYLPLARATYRNAAGIIAASSQTYSEFAAYRDKLFFVPEPGMGLSQCSLDSRSPQHAAKLELIFLAGWFPGRLAILLCAPLLRFCEVIWPALPWSAMARSGATSSSLRDPLGSRRPFSSAAGSVMRKSSSTCDLPMCFCFHPFVITVQAQFSKLSAPAPYLWSRTSAAPETLFIQRWATRWLLRVRMISWRRWKRF